MRVWSLAVLFASTTAAAQPRTRADELFERGRKLMAAGNYAEACVAFEESQQLDAAVTTLLNLGACREKREQLASAVAVFHAAELSARREGTAKSAALADIAAGHVKRLEPRLSTLTIQVPRAHRVPGLVIERDGVPVEAALWDVPVPLDGGAHRVVARAPGREEWQKDVKLETERQTAVVQMPALSPSTVGTPLPDDPKREDTDEPPPAGGGRSLVWPIVFGAGALAAGTGAIVFWRKGDATYARAEDETLPARQDELWKEANRQRYIAQGLAVTGVVFAGVAVWLLVRRGNSTDNNRQVAIEPTGEGMMVHLRGSY